MPYGCFEYVPALGDPESSSNAVRLRLGRLQQNANRMSSSRRRGPIHSGLNLITATMDSRLRGNDMVQRDMMPEKSDFRPSNPDIFLMLIGNMIRVIINNGFVIQYGVLTNIFYIHRVVFHALF